MGVPELAPADAELVTLNGLDYFVRDSGGEGEPVVFLHGAPDHGVMWRHQYAAIADGGYRAICPDLLGYGSSARAGDVERYRFDLMAADLSALFRRLELEPGGVHLVAHDFGATLGWNLAAGDPHWFASYCAMSVGHADAFFGGLSLEHVRWTWNLFLNHHPQAIEMISANDGALFKTVIADHPDADEVWEGFREDPDGLEAMLDWERANHIPEVIAAAYAGGLPERVAPNVAVPTLGVWSERDSFLWEEQMAESGEFVDADWRYERIEDAGHWFMLDRPDRTNELLLSWLETNRAKALSGAAG
jgi:pimeloyl-ACP methyl ester carboxylesterase